MDDPRQELLARFEREMEATIPGIVASAFESPAYSAIRDTAPRDELADIARQHLSTFLHAERQHRAVKADELTFLRERAAQRARELIPLAAMVNAHLTATRRTIEEMTPAAGSDPSLQAEAFTLIAHFCDYNALAVAFLVNAYTETVEGERADREADRRILLEELLSRSDAVGSILTRRARSLGLEVAGLQTVVCVTTTASDVGRHASIARWAADSLARASGRSAGRAFIVVRPNDLVAVLDCGRGAGARNVLTDLVASAAVQYGASIRAGMGIPFADLSGFRESYEEAQRGLRHANASRPVVSSPEDIELLDELVMASGDAWKRLIPAAVRQALADHSWRLTLQAFLDADMNVGAAAEALSLHPNSLRYRLRSIANATGRDPRRPAELFELCAAARTVDAEESLSR